MNTSIEASDRHDPLQNALRSESEYIYVVNPTKGLLQEIVDASISPTPSSTEDDEIVIDELTATLRIVGEVQTLRSVSRDFVLSTNIADLVDTRHLEMGSYNGEELQSSGTVVVSEDTLIGSVTVPFNGGAEVLLESPNDLDPEEIYTSFTKSWGELERFDLRDPGRHRIYRSLCDEFDDVVAEDYLDLLTLLADTDEIDNEDVDGATLGLMIGAKHRELLYNIGRWGEENDVASKATFSREKGRLDDFGLLDMEKVPIDVGRPRLRLDFSEDVEDTSIEGLANEIIKIS